MRRETRNHCEQYKNVDEHNNINVWVPIIFKNHGYELVPISSHIYLSINYTFNYNEWEILL